MLTPLAQLLTHSSFIGDWISFKRNAGDLRSIQSKLLEETLKRHPFLKNKEDFLKQPLHDYPSLMAKLSKVNFPIVRNQPTSGSGEKEKLIPYTRAFIGQLNKALNPWLFDMCKTHPRILEGKHYWSISWLPTHWRQKGWDLNDFELLPQWKKRLTQKLMAVPHEVSQAATLSSSQFATLAYLMSRRDLTFLSVWSPTFLLQLLELTVTWRDQLRATLKSGKWGLFAEELKHLKAPFNPTQAEVLQDTNYKDLWPKLSLISSWDSSTSSTWAKKLCTYFPDAKFQGKGLWATEGVVTIPFEGKFVLSYLSHYYEFLDLKSGDLFSAADLKDGMEVHPVLTCQNGFTRYWLKDRLTVSGHYRSVPTLEFMERDNSFDMVGEKIDTHTFLQIHDHLKQDFPELKWVTAFAVNAKTERPYYSFVFEGQSGHENVLKMVRGQLHEHFHYQLAKEIGQLGEEVVIIDPHALEKYEDFQLRRGMVQGNIKVELAYLIKGHEEGNLFRECFTQRA